MSYIGRQPQIGNFQICDAISTVNNQAAYTMQVGSVNVLPETANHMIVSLNGVIQAPISSYTVSGSTITFAANLVTGDVINFIQILGDVLDLGVPSDNTVSTAKIANGAVTSAKLASGVGGVAGITSSANATAMTISDDENVCIGTADPDSFENSANNFVISGSGSTGMTINSSNSGEVNMYFADGTSGNEQYRGYFQYNHSSDFLQIGTAGANQWKLDSSGNWLPSATDNGIYLGTTSATASNLLDDYEEGTWEATIQCGSGTVTLNSSNNLCKYTKIGRSVLLSGSLGVSSVSSPSGDLRINGMPFPSGSGEGGERATGAFCLYNPTDGLPPALIAQIFGGYASIRIESSQAGDRSQSNHVQGGSELRFTINYQIGS